MCGVFNAHAPTCATQVPQFNDAVSLHDRAEALAAELRRYLQELPEHLEALGLHIAAAAANVDQATQNVSSYLVDLVEHLARNTEEDHT
jgi:hypothetical protein